MLELILVRIQRTYLSLDLVVLDVLLVNAVDDNVWITSVMNMVNATSQHCHLKHQVTLSIPSIHI